jgi:hypothetical protein
LATAPPQSLMRKARRAVLRQSPAHRAHAQRVGQGDTALARLDLPGSDRGEVAAVVESSYRLAAPRMLVQSWEAGVSSRTQPMRKDN